MYGQDRITMEQVQVITLRSQKMIVNKQLQQVVEYKNSIITEATVREACM